jgi:integrase
MDIGLPPAERTLGIVSAICEPGKDRKTGERKAMYRKQTKSRRRRQSIYYRSLSEPMAERVAEVEAEHGPEGLLFPGPDGDFVSRLWFRQHRLLPALHEAGWEFRAPRTPRHNWRSLRHLAATTMLFDLGFHINLVSLMLGHRDTSFTFRQYIGHRGDAIGRAHDATEDV